jgi:hypothetical protein
MESIMITEEEMKELVEKYLGDQSFVLVIFNERGSVFKSIAMNNVVPSQLLALGAEFELFGKNGILAAQEMQSQPKQPKIVVPSSQIEVP